MFLLNNVNSKIKGNCLNSAIVCFFILIIINSCTPIHQIIALSRSTNKFHLLANNVYIENKADIVLGNQIQPVVPLLIDSVENKLSLKYYSCPGVFICHTIKSFCQYTGSKYPGPRACVPNNFFISPRLADSPDWKEIVYHELVHSIFKQHLGVYKYQKVPVWFNEGLATLISNGGGTGDITDDTARSLILEGKQFSPVEHENFIFPSSFENQDISLWIQYRQAMLFVSFLREKDTIMFHRLIKDISQGIEFKNAISVAYDQSVPDLWNLFINKIKR
jgi:hypothetical protein